MDLITFRAGKKLARELSNLQKSEDLDKSSAARKAFGLGVTEWKKQEAVRLILAGTLSLGRAAAILEMPLYQLILLLKEKRADFISIREQDLDRELSAAGK